MPHTARMLWSRCCLVLCAAVVSGCTLVNNLDEYTAGSPAPLDGGDSSVDVAVDTAPVTCTAAQKSCGGACREKTDDKFGCIAATCDPCSFKNAAAGGCDDKGACKLGACAANFGNCNGIDEDGCELAVDTAVDDCGKCGNHCGGKANATMTCVVGACAIGGCSSGFGDCNKKVDDGCETATDTLPNCGACGNTCASIAHASADCVSSKCTLKTCNAGFVDCDGNPDNGCECGAAGGAATCGVVSGGDAGSDADASGDAGAGGTCTFLGCAAGFADCNKNLTTDGCEVSLLTDAANCGKCGLSCEGATCAGGICQPTVLAKGQAFPGQLALDRDY